MKLIAIVAMTALTGCITSSPYQIGQNAVLASWTLPTAPAKSAACIARDIEERNPGIYTAHVHPAHTPGAFQIYQQLYAGPISYLVSIAPEGTGSRVEYRSGLATDTRPPEDVMQLGVKDCW